MMSGPIPSQTYQALYRACMKEAAAQGRTLMQRLVVRAGDTLPRAAQLAPDETERRLLRDASHTLLKHEQSLCNTYPQSLLAEFAHAISGDTRKGAGLSFDTLELMGDEQMRESVELVRLQQLVDSQVEAELADLNTLVSAVQGLQVVEADRNPLRPEVYVRSLRSALQQSPVPHAVRSRWMLHLGQALGPELARMYRELAAWMRAQGVAEARFQAVPAAEPPAAAASTALNLHDLKRLLSGELAGEPAALATAAPEQAPAFSATLPAALELLKDRRQVDEVMKRMSRQPLTEPRARAHAIAQEVVAMMVDTLAGDARLLAPVRESVRQLGPALQRLAHEDPRFFSDRKHPARRLLEELTQRSLAWHSVEAPGFGAFIEPLQQAVEVLRETRVGGAGPFDFALQTLLEAWGAASERGQHQREKVVRTLLQAEQRNLLAERIAREMRQRPDVASAPPEIAAFITGPWSQVMAQARLADASGAPDPGGYTSIVTDLVWSTQPRVAGAQPTRLLKLVPVLGAKVRDGLATIDYPARAAQRFLDRLGQLHRRALRDPEAASPSNSVTPWTAEDVEAMEDASGESSWLAPCEAQESNFVDTQQTVPPRPFNSTQSVGFTDTRPEPREAAPDIPVAELQPGAWVEMVTGSGWQRFQVTWASPHGTLFMFTGAHGEPQSMTKRLLGKMLQGGSLRLVSSQAVVQGALDAVANAAARNSLRQ